jgi:two-component system chemotaxis sensor kinase CheA
MIEDEELRLTFRTASEEHLEKLDEGLLQLEQNPHDTSGLAEMMREAHSLKGDANMLGVKDVGTLAHQLEHILGNLKRGEIEFTPELCDRFSYGLNAIRQLVDEAVTGIPCDINAFYALARLMGAPPPSEEPPTPAPTEAPPETPAPPTPPLPKSHRYLEDEELRTTFKIACEEHLQKLDDGILYLEQNPLDLAKLEALLREAHSIKGDAGMLGVTDVGTLAHQLENILNSLKRGELLLTPAVCDCLSIGLSAIHELVHEAVTGEPRHLDFNGVLAQMALEIAAPPAETPLPPIPPAALSEPVQPPQTSEIEVSPVVTLPPASQPVIPQTAPPAETNGYRIETIRVETRNLDGLMTQAGELTVTKIRIAHRLNEIEEILSLWEEWSRDTFIHRFALDELERGLRANSDNGSTSAQPLLFNRRNGRNNTLKQIQNLYHRTEERLEHLGTLINQLRSAFYEDTARLEVVAGELEEGIRTLRLLPLSTIFHLYPRMVRDLARVQNKEVEFILEGGETRADKRILEEMKDPLMHMIRNAIDHGIETPAERIAQGKPAKATLKLRGYQTATNIIIEVSDDGRGLDIESIKRTALKRGLCREEELATMTLTQIQSLIFSPGFSTRSFVTEVSGRGVGLDVVRTNVERLKGTIQVESAPGQGCTLRLQLGTTLSTAHVLLLGVNGMTFALPVEFVQMARLVPETDIFTIEGRQTIIIENQPISVAKLAELLELPAPSVSLSDNPSTETQQTVQPCIILKVGEECIGLLVDDLIDEQDVVLKPQSKLLKRVRNVAGATILGTGEVCIVLNPQDLVKSIRRSRAVSLTPLPAATKIAQKPIILLVEDSIATRTQEKRILESAGYEVVTAVDGLDAYNKLKIRDFDAVVSDIQMPNLSGLELTAKIRRHKEYRELPIILVTSLASDEDKQKGADAGANAYITKSAFNQELLIETLQRLV